MLSLIYLMIFLGCTLLEAKAKMILPFDKAELGMISLVFQLTLLFFKECALGTDLQSVTTNYLSRATIMSTSNSLCFHLSFVLYLKVNSMLLLLTSMVYTNRSGILSVRKVSLRII